MRIKRLFGEPCSHKTRSVYQDRLGAVEKKEIAFSAGYYEETEHRSASQQLEAILPCFESAHSGCLEAVGAAVPERFPIEIAEMYRCSELSSGRNARLVVRMSKRVVWSSKMAILSSKMDSLSLQFTKTGLGDKHKETLKKKRFPAAG